MAVRLSWGKLGWWWMMGKSESLPTIWEVPDDLWERIEPVILELDSPQGEGAQTGEPAEDAGRRHLPYA